MKELKYPIILDKIFEKLNDNEIKPVIVGGFIRDFFLGIESKDIDIELFGATSYEQVEKLLQEFGKTCVVGKSFGVLKLFYDDLDLDFSFPRTDNKVSKGHKGFEIEFLKNTDFKTAASRRDFTINAIGYDVIEKKFLDPYNGIDDIQSKVLKAVKLKNFREDPLRVFRALQFASRFDLRIDEDLFVTCNKMIMQNEFNTLPKERIYTEMEKLCIKSTAPSVGFLLLRNMGMFHFFKEFQILESAEYERIISLLDNLGVKEKIDNIKNTMCVMLAVLTSRFKMEIKINFLNKFTEDKKIIHTVINLHNYLQTPSYSLAMRLDIDVIRLYFTMHNIKNATYLANQTIPKIHGKDLIRKGLQPSKKFSELLDREYLSQLQKSDLLQQIHFLLNAD